MNGTTFEQLEKDFAELASPGIVPGLDRLFNLLPQLGNPQDRFCSVHVVGTNGKGSTCATLTSILRAAGFKVALYTSPHLISFGERLLIDGKQVMAKKWHEALRKIKVVLGECGTPRHNYPTYFELITAAAFMIIAEEKPDIAVVEAGLGGRLDATNALGGVQLTLVTSIGMDHMEYLGNDLFSVAAEKFAVMRAGVPAIFAFNERELEKEFLKVACEKGAKGMLLRNLLSLETTKVSFSGTDFVVKRSGAGLEFHTPLIGNFQAENAALAIAGASLLGYRLARRKHSAWIPQHIIGSLQAGVNGTSWAGRMEAVSQNPLTLLDGAHNPHAMARIAETLAGLVPKGSLNIVLAQMKDKEIDESLKFLKSLKPTMYCTQVPRMERCMSARSLQELVERAGLDFAGEFSDPVNAVKAARATGRTTICCGSLYLVGYLKEKADEFRTL